MVEGDPTLRWDRGCWIETGPGSCDPVPKGSGSRLEPVLGKKWEGLNTDSPHYPQSQGQEDAVASHKEEEEEKDEKEGQKNELQGPRTHSRPSS